MTRDELIADIQFGLTQDDLARHLGVSRDKFIRMARALDIQWAKVKGGKITEKQRESRRQAAALMTERRKAKAEAFGVEGSFVELHKKFGVTSYNTFLQRMVKCKMPIEKALTEPLRGERNAKAKSVLPKVPRSLQQQEQSC